MKAFLTAFISLVGFCAGVAGAADDFAARAWQMESKGDAAEARDYLQHAAQTGAADAGLAYAQFLDRHRDPAARGAYEKVRDSARGEQRELAARRIVILDLTGGRSGCRRSVTWSNTAPPVVPTSVFLRFPPDPARSRKSLPSRGRCVPSRAWPRWRPKSAPTTCCPRWPATSSPTAIRPPAVTTCWSRPNI